MYIHSWYPVPLGKYLARVDTCCFRLPGSQAWLWRRASGIILRERPFPHSQAAGFRHPQAVPKRGPWPGMARTLVGARAPDPGRNSGGKRRPLSAGFAELVSICSPGKGLQPSLSPSSSLSPGPVHGGGRGRGEGAGEQKREQGGRGESTGGGG